MSRTSGNTRRAARDRYRWSKVERLALAASALLPLITASCARRDEEAAKPAPSASVSAAPQATATQGSGDKGAAAEPQPDFLQHPPVHLKPPCASASESAADEGGHRCVKLTLRCPELDRGESVWLATTPPVAKVRLPEGARGLQVADEDQVSATICCKPASAEPRPVKAQIRLFTNEVAGAVHALDCP